MSSWRIFVFQCSRFLKEGFPFPEDMVPSVARVESLVPFMTLESSVCDLLRIGGIFSLLRWLWDHFCSTLGKREPEYTVN